MFFFRPLKIGKIAGIPLRVDPSWVLIFLLLTYQLAVFVLPYELGVSHRRGLALDVIVLAVTASILLFASVVAHELGHALMARLRGVPVLSITLFIFGGVAQIGDEPDSPQTEFLIAIVGPLISLLIAIAAAGIWIWTQALESLGVFRDTSLETGWVYIAVVGFYLAQANFLLAVFNLLPGFPLDGGRVLRAGLWVALKNQMRATYWSMVSGRGMAILLALAGGWFVVRGNLSGGWLVLMAWFLWRAAGEAYHALVARELLKEITVAQLMRAPLPRISEALSLRELADSFASWLVPPAVAVDLNGSAVGLIGLEQVKKVDRARWETTRVRQAITPLAAELYVAPTAPALAALKLLTERERDQVAVVQEGQVIGSIGRQELARYLQARGE